MDIDILYTSDCLTKLKSAKTQSVDLFTWTRPSFRKIHKNQKHATICKSIVSLIHGQT